MLGLGYHKIQQGNVGIYYVAGALSDETTQPGLHYANPVWTTVKQVEIRSKTDKLPAITTVTKDGIENKFHDVEVITAVKESEVIRLIKRFGLTFHKTLVFDRIYEEIRLFCANHTVDEVYNTKFLTMVGTVESNVNQSIADLGKNGITLYHLTIPKPDIPNDIAENYQAVKVQWTEQLVAKQRQKTEEIKKETEQLNAVADAERQNRCWKLIYRNKFYKKKVNRSCPTWRIRFWKIVRKKPRMLKNTRKKNKPKPTNFYMLTKDTSSWRWQNPCRRIPNSSFPETTAQ